MAQKNTYLLQKTLNLHKLPSESLAERGGDSSQFGEKLLHSNFYELVWPLIKHFKNKKYIYLIIMGVTS